MSENVNVIKRIKRTILIVEDELINQQILAQILSEDYETIVAENGLEALQKLKSALTPISLILLDINMPIMDGLEFLKVVKKEKGLDKIPIIVLTAEKQNELKALELGAVDFIPKPYNHPEIVLARVNRSIELSEDRMIIQASERDEVTGVYNKHIFIEYVDKMDLYNVSSNFDMVVIDLERFHLFNELYGREAGDRALFAFAEVLKEVARNHNGIVGRLQSDYFVLYMAHQDDYNALYEQIHSMLQERLPSADLSFHMGAYNVVDQNESIESRIDRARVVCDSIRGSNKGHVSVFDDRAKEDSLFNEKLIQSFHQGIAEHQFKVFYQPKVSIQGKRKLVSAEALIRWIHPEYGFISPGVFIPLFEENGFIRELDRYVWDEAAKQVKAWKDKFGKTIPVSVNVSRIDMFDYGVVNDLIAIVKNAGIAPSELHLEVTESAYHDEQDQVIEIVSQFQEAGFKIEIDDFGSGYSSLNTLATLPFDVLKLDMQFVRAMFTNDKTTKMVQIVADLAKFLKVTTVAEGVETEEQCHALEMMGYDIVQGYFFSKPVKPEEFEAFFTKEF